MTDYALPNGKILTGLSAGYTPDQIKQIAVNGGYATEKDFQRNQQTGADWAAFAGELGGGMGGAVAGGMVGSAILPGPGTFIGGLVGGAAGTFMGSMAGQQAEAFLEGRSLQGAEMAREAGRAAAVDTAAGLGLGIVGKGIKAIALPLWRLAKPAARATPEVDTLLGLQSKLGNYETGLLPSQIGDLTATGRAAETYAASSKAFEPEYDKIVQGFDNYTKGATESLLSRLAQAPREEVGTAFRQLSAETEKAVKTAVDPLYKTIDEEGGLVFAANEVRDRVNGYLNRISAGGVGRVSTKAQEAVRLLAGLPDEITPAMLASDMGPILRRVETLASSGDAQATGISNILNSYVARVRNNPALVDTSSTIASASSERLRRVSEAGESRMGGAYGQAVDYISGMRKKMSFSEAKEELSFLKAQLRDAENPASPSTAAARIYSRAVGQLEQSMEDAAKSFNQDLYQKYRYASDFYKRGQETIYAPYMREALNSNEPAKVGELLARVGYVTPPKELDALISLADSLGVKGGGRVREGVTRSYLESLFKSGDAATLNNFNKDMANPRFRETFEAVVPKDMAQPILQLAEEAAILARHASGGSAASLGVGSREIAALESPGKLQSIVFGLLPGVVRSRLSNEAIQGKLQAMKKINEQIANGQQPGAGLVAYVVRGLPTIGLRTGFAAGAAVDK